MTAKRLQELALRKQILQQRSADLRQTLALQSNQTLAPVFAVADKVNTGRRWLVSHPVVVAGVVLLLFRRRKPRHNHKGWLAWGRRAVWLWGTWRRLQPLLGGRANT